MAWTELAKETQTGTAGPRVSLVLRSNPGHTLQLYKHLLLHPFAIAVGSE